MKSYSDAVAPADTVSEVIDRVELLEKKIQYESDIRIELEKELAKQLTLQLKINQSHAAKITGLFLLNVVFYVFMIYM